MSTIETRLRDRRCRCGKLAAEQSDGCVWHPEVSAKYAAELHRRVFGDGLRVYIELRDWWIGYYRAETHHYVCPIPTVVIRWPRRGVSA